jgi:hypothetical protein
MRRWSESIIPDCAARDWRDRVQLLKTFAFTGREDVEVEHWKTRRDSRAFQDAQRQRRCSALVSRTYVRKDLPDMATQVSGPLHFSCLLKEGRKVPRAVALINRWELHFMTSY